jgi:thiamine transport system permease protein
MRRPPAALALPAVAFGLVFFVWPMASILTTGLTADSGRIGSILAASSTLHAVWFTVWQAAVSTALTLAAGLPVAFVLSRFRFRGRNLVRTIVTIPFVLPTVVVAIAFLELAGPGGLLGVDLSGTIWLILAAHVFFNLAVVVRTVGGLWSHLDPRLEEAAAALGASPWTVWRTVTLPLLRPAIAAAGVIVFLFSFTSFGAVLLLGAPNLATIEVEVYRAAALVFDLPAAAVLALIQVIGVTAGLVVYARHQERSSIGQHLLPAAAVGRAPRGRERWTVAGVIGMALVITLVPLAAILLRTVTAGGGFGLAALQALWKVDPALVDVPGSIGNSLRFAAITAVLAIVIALPAAVLVASRRSRSGRWIDTLLMLPIGSSAVTLGFGFVVALDSPIDLRAWWGLVPVAHTLVAMPFVLRSTVPVIRSIAPRVREAAAVLGAAPGRLWRTIDLPMISPATAGAAALAFVVSLGEFGATLFVARPGGQTMTLAIYRLLGRPGAVNASAALGLSVLLAAITALVITRVDRLRVPGVGSF